MRFARLICAGFGIGYVPVAGGTVASAVAVLLGGELLLASRWLLAAAALIATVGGLIMIRRAEVEGDPGWIVIDEIAGQWIALLALRRPAATGLIGAFVLFRALDILKIGPVGWADRQPGPFGIMADDVIAGGLAALPLLAAWASTGLE